MEKGDIINQTAANTHVEINKELPSMSMELKNDGITLSLSSGEILMFLGMMVVLVLGTIGGMVWFTNTLKGFGKQ